MRKHYSRNKMSYLATRLIRFYQYYISGIKPKNVHCRFYPTCSKYAIMAIRKYGVIKGIIKTFNRLRKCNKYNLESCIDYP